MSFSLEELEAIIRHQLLTGWFMLGNLVMKQIEGLPMGSGLGTALARMVLVFLDVLFMMSPSHPIVTSQPQHRCRHVIILNVTIVLLEIRYVDDYLAIWKFVGPDVEDLVHGISEIIRSNLRLRYPLPLEDDTADKFLGLDLLYGISGLVGCRPSLAAPQLYDRSAFTATMLFSSFLPSSMKKSIVLGTISRVDRYTLPLSAKPDVLREFLGCLSSHGFPDQSLKRWALAWRSSSGSWIRSIFLQ